MFKNLLHKKNRAKRFLIENWFPYQLKNSIFMHLGERTQPVLLLKYSQYMYFLSTPNQSTICLFQVYLKWKAYSFASVSLTYTDKKKEKKKTNRTQIKSILQNHWFITFSNYYVDAVYQFIFQSHSLFFSFILLEFKQETPIFI